MSFKNQKKFAKMCRLCMSETAVLVNLYTNSYMEMKPSSNNFVNVIERFTTIKISPTDDLPQKICQGCIKTLNSMLQFQNKCKRSDVELHRMLQILDDIGKQPEIKIEFLEIPDTEDTVTDDPPDEQSCETQDEPSCETQDEPSCETQDEPPDETVKSALYSSDENDFTFRYENTTRTYGQDQDQNYISSEDEFVQDTDDIPKTKSWRVKQVACHLCGKLYDSFKLQFHINRHNGLKPYECKEANCTSSFAAPYQLNRHKKLCHTDKEPKLFCDVCGRGFKLQSYLKMHRSYHFDPELPCTFCEKLFRNKRALKVHMLVHSQERKFPCDICDKSFQTRYTLRIHKRVHTQEKPYSCNCGTAFAYKCLLKSHIEKCHKETNS